MSDPSVPDRDFALPQTPKLRILSIDGGGIRGLIPAIVLADLERRISIRSPGATLASCFDLIAGTSTGGLIALGLATPGRDGAPAITGTDMVGIYAGAQAREIFERPPLRRIPGLRRLSDLLDPRYRLAGLERVLERHFGDRRLADALTGLLITCYDMREREPRFLKPWQEQAREMRAVDAGLATAAAPTYFPALRTDGAALVDGGVFANNPVIAAAIESLKRTEGEPVRPEDLLVLSLGTGHYERGYDPDRVAGWGALGWVLPSKGEPPLIAAMLDGQSDAADHWAHMLLNHRPGTRPARGKAIGAGPRYFRHQIDLTEPLPLDGVEPGQIARLRSYGETLRDGRAAELDALAAALAG